MTTSKRTRISLETDRAEPQRDPLDVLTKGNRARWWRRIGNKDKGFQYLDAKGNPITEEAQLARIRSLAIPPGYREVRVAPSARSPLQAIALDSSGRVQYRYHAKHQEKQSQAKYDKLVRFGEHLAALRQRTNDDLAREGLGRERVLAVVLRLINDLYFRLGSESSVQQYRTYGVTTLRNRHLHIEPDGVLRFQFIGKHHILQRRLLVDSELAALMEQIKAIGGAKLFEYLDASGHVHAITPADVNHYIKEAMGNEFSAKDFRTWGGTLLTATTLAEMGKAETETQIKKNLVAAVKQVAERLGNTPTVCRNCYISPVVLERYREGVTLDDFQPRRRRVIPGQHPLYTPEEKALLKLMAQPATE